MTDTGAKSQGVASLLTARRTFLLKDSIGEIPSNMHWGIQELQKWGTPVEEIAPAPLLKKSTLVRSLSKIFGVNFIYAAALWRARADVNRLGALYTITPNGALVAVLLRSLGILHCRVILLLTGLTMFKGTGKVASLKQKLLSKWFSKINRIMVTSTSEVDGLKRKIADGESVAVFNPLCIDLNFYQPVENGARKDDFILIIGNDENRDWSTSLEIVRNCPSLKFKIISSYFLNKELKMPDNCEYLGNPPFADSRKEFQHAAIVLIVTKPSTYFSGITTVLAAMACGAVVVSDDSKSAGDYGMKESENYLRYDRGDLPVVSKILHSILESAELRLKIRNEGYENVKNYGMDRFAAVVKSCL